MVMPFEQHNDGEFIIRTFSESVDDYELKWHTDAKNRIVTPLVESDWKLQIDGELPIPLIKDQQYYIAKEIYHRVIKGNGNLIIKIYEIN